LPFLMTCAVLKAAVARRRLSVAFMLADVEVQLR
jgi:hypothetical protein